MGKRRRVMMGEAPVKVKRTHGRETDARRVGRAERDGVRVSQSPEQQQSPLQQQRGRERAVESR